MTESIYPVFPVMLVDDEVQALDSFEIALRSASMNHFIRCQDSRDVMPMLSGAGDRSHAAGFENAPCVGRRAASADKQRLSRNYPSLLLQGQTMWKPPLNA